MRTHSVKAALCTLIRQLVNVAGSWLSSIISRSVAAGTTFGQHGTASQRTYAHMDMNVHRRVCVDKNHILCAQNVYSTEVFTKMNSREL